MFQQKRGEEIFAITSTDFENSFTVGNRMNHLYISRPYEIDFMLWVHFQQHFHRAAFEQLNLPQSVPTKIIMDNTEHRLLVNTDLSRYLVHGTVGLFGLPD